jgi:methyl-accepting chemotaxis protein
MEEIQDRVRGSAEKLADPIDVLKASMSDLGEQVGSYVAPILKDLSYVLTDLSSDVQDFMKKHEAGSREATEWATAVGAGATAAGGLAIIIPKATELLTKFGGSALKGTGYVAGLTIGLSMMTKGFMDLFEVKSSTDTVRAFSEMLNEANQKITDGTMTIQEYNNILGNAIEAQERHLAVGKSVHGLTVEQINSMTEWIATAKETYAANENMIQSLKDEADAIDRANGAMSEQEKRLQSLLAELSYNSSAAGELGLTMDSLYNYMWKMGYGAVGVADVLTRFGDSADGVQSTLHYLGLSAEEVARTLGIMSDEALRAQRDAESLDKQLQDLFNHLDAVDTEAYAMGLTMEDVYLTMKQLGYSTEEISRIFAEYGYNTDLVQQALDELGLSADQVKQILDALREKTSEITQSFDSQAASVSRAKSALGEYYATIASGGGVPGGAQAAQQGLVDARNAYMEANPGVSQAQAGLAVMYGNGSPYVQQNPDGGYSYIPMNDKGGYIDEPSLIYGLKSRRVIGSMAENGGEYIVPDRVMKQGGGGRDVAITIPVNIGGQRLTTIVARLIGDELKIQR